MLPIPLDNLQPAEPAHMIERYSANSPPALFNCMFKWIYGISTHHIVPGTWHPTSGWTSENGQIRDLQGDLNVPERESVKNMLIIPDISKACEDYVEVVRTDARLFDLYFADRSIDFLPHLQQLMHNPHHVFPGSTTLRPDVEALQQLHHMSVHDTPHAPASGHYHGQGDVNMEPASADSEVARVCPYA